MSIRCISSVTGREVISLIPEPDSDRRSSLNIYCSWTITMKSLCPLLDLIALIRMGYGKIIQGVLSVFMREVSSIKEMTSPFALESIFSGRSISQYSP